jgi:uncharacterized membrane protein YfcA
MDILHEGLAVLCGGLVGLTLGLIGGGGSILATPLLLYVVGLPPHVAIGTGALSVSANALFNFAGHARCGNVRWKSALIFAVVGAVGAIAGSTLGKRFDGQHLLLLFALLMVVVGALMLRPKSTPVAKACDYRQPSFAALAPKVSASALVVGALSGFFGIGGGFLIVPGLLVSTQMPMIYAIGSSLLAVSSFGIATAANYAYSGLIDWPVAGLYIIGGFIGGLIGMKLANLLAPHHQIFSRLFASIIFVVAAYMIVRTLGAMSMT